VGFKDSALTYGTTDLSVQVSRMKDAGVDIIYPCLDLQGVVTLAKELKKQQVDAIQIMPNSYDKELTDDFGDLFEGSYVQTYFAPFETPDPPPGLSEFKTQMEKAGLTITENSIVGWLNAALFVEGLKAAGPEFTQAKVVEAINKMDDWTADGVLAGVDWTTQHTAAPRFCPAVSRIEGSAFVPAFTEEGKPFVCWDNGADSLKETHES
jgi:ABC-type branched-subunit amino acid transport system substrate-binding protein